MLLKAGFKQVRSKGSHRIYIKDNKRIVIPFHPNKTLHPKIVKQVVSVIEFFSHTNFSYLVKTMQPF